MVYNGNFLARTPPLSAEQFLPSSVLIVAVTNNLSPANRLTLAQVKDIVGVVRDLFIILGVLLYFIGYAYRATYLRSLSVPAGTVSTSVSEISIYTFAVVSREVWLIVAYVSICSLLWFTVRSFTNFNGKVTPRGATAVSLIITVLSLFPFANFLAGDAAKRDATDLRRGLLSKPYRISFSDISRKKLFDAEPLLVLAAEKQSVFIVQETEKMIYVLVQSVENQKPSGMARTFWIRKDDVETISEATYCDLENAKERAKNACI